jgi:hypothetical protein
MNFFSLNSCPGTNRLGRYRYPERLSPPVETIVARSARTAIVAPAAIPARGRRRGPKMRVWLIRSVIAFAALAVMANGVSWELTDAPAAANELVMARSVIDIISGDTAPANDARADPARITTKDTR